MRRRNSDDNRRVVEVRLTGSKTDVFAALTALGATHPGGWNLEINTTKTRETGRVQAYGHLVKTREAR